MQPRQVIHYYPGRLMLDGGAAQASYSLLPWEVDVRRWCSSGKLCFITIGIGI